MSSSKAPKTPQNYGRIIVEHNNTETLRFWVRVFELEPQLAFAQSKFNEHSAVAQAAHDTDHDPQWAMVPIISEYHAGHIKWIYALVFEIDTIGISGGTGVIYYADQANEADARERRNKFADLVMRGAEERTERGLLSEVFLTKPGAQE